MFFKRRASSESTSPVIAPATLIIPEVFYGGNNPELTVGSIKNNSSVSGASNSQSANVPASSRSRLVATVMVLIFLFVLSGGVWYFLDYFGILGKKSNTVITPTPVSVAPKISDPVIPVPTPPSSIITEATTTPAIQNSTTTVSIITRAIIEFPALIEIDAADLDADGLTDAEEEVLGSDSGIFDTDSDGYYDGLEVHNLYNPKGTAPVKLIDSGSVKDIVHPKNFYRFYSPVDWQVGLVDAAGDSTLITAENGDYIEVTISPKKSNEDFATWFARVAPDERITELQTAPNYFAVDYRYRKDNLTAYVEQSDSVLVIIYHPQSDAPITYRHIFQTMLASLRLNTPTSTQI